MEEFDLFDEASADEPLTNLEDDRLGYSHFAKHLASSIYKMPSSKGYVVAIYSAWGTGKSTLLNFIQKHLSDEFFRSSFSTETPIVVQFNPWWFQGHEDLVKALFDQILTTIAGEWHENRRKFARLLSELSNSLSKAPSTSLTAGIGILSYFMNRKTIPELKTEIAKILVQEKRKILVIIDDIDRLTADEIRHLFRTIKVVADFPNVVYLLAFDKEIVVEALNGFQGQSGEDYLEKIVQLPLELPQLDRVDLESILLERLGRIINDKTIQGFDRNYWFNLYYDGIRHLIETPRDVIRLTNALEVTFSAVIGEVNPFDFIAIEALRLFCPGIYNAIRSNKEMFVGDNDNDGFLANDRSVQTYYDEVLNRLKPSFRTHGKPLLMRLFPKLERIWSNTHHGGQESQKWRRDLRICSPVVFPVYFRLSPLQDSISNAEMRQMINFTTDKRAFENALIDLSQQSTRAGTTRVRLFLSDFQDYTKDSISFETIPTIIKSLFNIGDKLLLPSDDRPSFLEYGNDVSIGRIIFQLLTRVNEKIRFQILSEAMYEGTAIAVICDFLRTIGPRWNENGELIERSQELEDLINSEHLHQLEAIALRKVRSAAEVRAAFLQLPLLPRILFAWLEWTDGVEVKKWVSECLADPNTFASLLEQFTMKTLIALMTDKTSRAEYQLDIKSLLYFVDQLSLDNALNQLDLDNLDSQLELVIQKYKSEAKAYTLKDLRDIDAEWQMDGSDSDK